MTVNIGYDKYLGFPSDFQPALPCKFQAAEISELISAFHTGELAAIFVPAGALPYLSGGQIIAQAKSQASLESDFVAKELFQIADISSCLLGRINAYCTSSFWALLLALLPYYPKGTHLHFKETEGFYDLLKQTVEGKVNGAMVWSLILQQCPKEDKQVQALFKEKNLPLPIVYGSSAVSQTLVQSLRQFLSRDKQFYFQGFTKPNMKQLDVFHQAILEAQTHFIINI